MKEVAIPNKLYFRIGEVAGLLAVKPYVLRYWETEFPDIRPIKSKTGQRRYKRRDVELLVRIKDLLYQEKFTINGARKRLKEWDGEAVQAIVKEVVKVSPPPVPVPQPAAAPAPQQVKLAVPAAVGHDQKKLLAKIKKDLQSILEELRA